MLEYNAFILLFLWKTKRCELREIRSIYILLRILSLRITGIEKSVLYALEKELLRLFRKIWRFSAENKNKYLNLQYKYLLQRGNF